jgi:hypothetical protein
MDNADHRVAMHHLASERRAAGKPSWLATWKIKNLFSHEDGDAKAAEVAGKIAERIKGYCVLNKWLDDTSDNFDDTLEEVVWRLNDIAKAGGVEGAQDETNSALDELYDWADYKRVWIG